MKKKKLVIKEVVKVISDNLGNVIGKKYKEHYKNQEINYIVASFNELLNDLVGSKNAYKQVIKLKNLIKEGN